MMETLGNERCPGKIHQRTEQAQDQDHVSCTGRVTEVGLKPLELHNITPCALGAEHRAMELNGHQVGFNLPLVSPHPHVAIFLFLSF